MIRAVNALREYLANSASQEYDSIEMEQEKGYSQKPPSLLDLPFDAASSYMRGAAEGPAAIRRALKCDSSNMWSESGIDLGAEGALHDSGYIQPGPVSEPGEMLGLIRAGTVEVIDEDRKSVV